MKLATM